MVFEEEYIDSLMADPIEGTIRMVDRVDGSVSASEEWDEYQRNILIEACVLITEMIERYNHSTQAVASAQYPDEISTI